MEMSVFPGCGRTALPCFCRDGKELVVARKALEKGALADGNGPVLLGMAETAVAEAVELRRHGRGRLVPAHAAVDAAVGSARWLEMALRHQFRRPVAPSPARLGSFDAPQVERGKGRAEMQAVAGIAATGPQGRQVADDFPDGLHVHVGGGGRHLDGSQAGGQKHHPLAQLREAVFGAFHHLVAQVVAQAAEGGGEAGEHFLSFQLGHVLHRDQVGEGFPDQAGELVEQEPALVAPCRFLVVFRERLARRAPGEQRHPAGAEVGAHLGGGEGDDGFVEELGGVVVFVGVLAAPVGIDAHAHVHAGLAQAASQAAAAAKKIDGVDAKSLWGWLSRLGDSGGLPHRPFLFLGFQGVSAASGRWHSGTPVRAWRHAVQVGLGRKGANGDVEMHWKSSGGRAQPSLSHPFAAILHWTGGE